MRTSCTSTLLLGWIATLLGPPHAAGRTPDWLQAVLREPLPAYPAETEAVMLWNEQVTVIKPGGEETAIYRRAYKILRQEGRQYGTVRIFFDSETRVTSLKGWSLPAAGAAYELGEKNALDTILVTENFYDDSRQKVLNIPAETGAVIGYEYEQRRRPHLLETQWWFQEEVPVRQARFELRLPAGWEYREFWANHPAILPRSTGAGQIWELKDIPALKQEPGMPAWRASAGQLLLAYVPPNGGGTSKSWAQLAQWYGQLVSDRREMTADMRRKAAELTASVTGTLAKARALAEFVQRDVRYVAIEIGIGGYQPHPAPDTFKNRYGDCKDKVSLLSAMLNEIGVESYYVLINARRGIVVPKFPSILFFNHVILAIRLPADVPEANLHGILKHPQIGSLLFFDPTDPDVPLGYLPAELQSNYGLLVTGSGGELVKLPLAAAPDNGLARTARLQLGTSGEMTGDVKETLWGTDGFDFCGAWSKASESDRKKRIQGRLPEATEVNRIAVTGLERPDSRPSLSYSVRLAHYVSEAGDLLLLRPRIFSQWAENVLESPERKHPVEFPTARIRTEIVEITLPAGYTVDELPPPLQADMGTLSYSSQTELEGTTLRYRRQMQTKDVLVSGAQLADLKKFYRQIAASEKASVVMRKK